MILMKSRIKLFQKIKTVDMKLEKTKKYQFVFKLNIKEIKCKKVQKSALQNIEMFCNGHHKVI